MSVQWGDTPTYSKSISDFSVASPWYLARLSFFQEGYTRI